MAQTTNVTTSSYDTGEEIITYSVEQKSLSYTTIGNNIRNDFKFLKGTLCDNLDNMLKELEKGTSNASAFYFENGQAYSDLVHVYDEIKGDVDSLKTTLKSLYDAFMTDIDNINAELENNYGYWIFASATEAGREVKTK